MSFTIFEIGANIGSETSIFAEQGNVYAFEPNIVLFEQLKEKFQNKENVKLFNYAVDTENTKKTFHVSNLETGIGSLYNLHPRLLETEVSRYECYKQGFHEKYDVDCIRMDTFIERENINQIDILWCDAQGNDFNVLKSFGDKLKIVKQGRCECTYNIQLYENTNNYYGDVVTFLVEKGFSVKADYWHAHGSEVDIKFWRE